MWYRTVHVSMERCWGGIDCITCPQLRIVKFTYAYSGVKQVNKSIRMILIALDGRDYTGLSALFTFNPGVMEQEVGVVILDDGVLEEDEEFYVLLSVVEEGRGVEVREDEERTNVTIIDNDGGCQLSCTCDRSVDVSHYVTKDLLPVYVLNTALNFKS